MPASLRHYAYPQYRWTLMLKKALSVNSPQSRFWTSLPQSLGTRDNSFNTAKFLGTLRASSSPVRLKLSGKLDRNDRVDFFRIDLAPGASFSSQIDRSTVQGGSVRVIVYFIVPGQSPTRVQTQNYRPGSYVEEFNTPFTNNLGFTLQIYNEVRSLSKNKIIKYRSQSLFK